MGLMEGEKVRGDGYRAAWVPSSQAKKLSKQRHSPLVSSHRPYYGQVTMSHMMGPPDVYPPSAYLPQPPNNQHTNNSYLPSVSYSLDHLDRLEYQVTSAPLVRFNLTGPKVLNVS